jgi:hypothetical protein
LTTRRPDPEEKPTVLNTTAPPTARSVDEELHRRNRCRYGLKGVKVAIAGQEGAFIIRGSWWDRDRRLCLEVLADTPEAVPFAIHAASAYLLSKWPVVCCRPRRRG